MNNFINRIIPVFLLATVLVSCGHGHKSFKNHFKLKKVVNSEHRSEKNRVRDVYRNPAATLKFFGVEPNMKVAEIAPGGGWYTEILGPYLRDEGILYLSIFSEESSRSYAPRLIKKIKELTANKKLFGEVHFTRLETPKVIEAFAPEGSLDRVLTFRNVHNWMADGKAAQVFSEMYKALKPGGVLGVVEHRARTNRKQDPKAKLRS